MSEVQKPVEEAVAPTTETPAAEPAAETKPLEETTEPVEASTESPAAVEEVAPVKEEVKPVEEGVLGYKGPGLLKYVLFMISCIQIYCRMSWLPGSAKCFVDFLCACSSNATCR